MSRRLPDRKTILQQVTRRLPGGKGILQSKVGRLRPGRIILHSPTRDCQPERSFFNRHKGDCQSEEPFFNRRSDDGRPERSFFVSPSRVSQPEKTFFNWRSGVAEFLPAERSCARKRVGISTPDHLLAQVATNPSPTSDARHSRAQVWGRSGHHSDVGDEVTSLNDPQTQVAVSLIFSVLSFQLCSTRQSQS